MRIVLFCLIVQFRKIKAATGGQGVDVIIEMLANVNLAKDLEMIGKNGRIIVSYHLAQPC